MENKINENTKEIKKSKAPVIIIIVACIATLAVIITWCLLMQMRENAKTKQIDTNTGRNEIINTVENSISNEIKQNIIDDNVNVNSVETQEIQEENNEQETKNEEQTENQKAESETTKEEKKNEGAKNTNAKSGEKQSISNSNKQNTNKQQETKTEENKKTEEVSKPAEPAKPTKTGTDTTKELTKTETKYGVTTNTYTITTYDVYSDGSKIEKSKKTETEYDNLGYSATTSELLSEAKQLKSQNASKINDVLKYTNELRKEKGIDELTLDSDLTVAACVRAMEMAYSGNFSHYRPNGSICFSVLNDMNIRYYTCAENIAKGQTTAKSATTWWKNSSGHYANMINEEYGKIGIGVIQYRGTYYWVQIFTN